MAYTTWICNHCDTANKKERSFCWYCGRRKKGRSRSSSQHHTITQVITCTRCNGTGNTPFGVHDLCCTACNGSGKLTVSPMEDI